MKQVINIEELAKFIFTSFNEEKTSEQEDTPTTIGMVQAMRHYSNEFASAVANTVCDTWKMSEKQAAVIARAVAYNDNKFKSFLSFCPSDCFTILEESIFTQMTGTGIAVEGDIESRQFDNPEHETIYQRAQENFRQTWEATLNPMTNDDSVSDEQYERAAKELDAKRPRLVKTEDSSDLTKDFSHYRGKVKFYAINVENWL